MHGLRGCRGLSANAVEMRSASAGGCLLWRGTKIPKTDDEIYQELLDALSQIDFGVKGFNEGVRSAYMGVAVELRKLLCDKRPLVNRILEKPAYHPLWHDVNEEQQPGWNLPFFTGSFITYDADVFDLNRPGVFHLTSGSSRASQGSQAT